MPTPELQYLKLPSNNTLRQVETIHYDITSFGVSLKVYFKYHENVLKLTGLYPTMEEADAYIASIIKPLPIWKQNNPELLL